MADQTVDAFGTKARRIADLRDELTVDSSKFERLCTLSAREMGTLNTFLRNSVDTAMTLLQRRIASMVTAGPPRAV